MTSSLPVIMPMSAKTIEPHQLEPLWDDPNWVLEPKFDGCRYLMYVEPEMPNRFFSRHNSVGTGLPVEKTAQVPHLSDKDLSWLGGAYIFDGEIITPEVPEKRSTSSEVVTIMGSDPEKAIARQLEKGKLIYFIFDVLYVKGESVMHRPFAWRRAMLEELFRENEQCFCDCGEHFAQPFGPDILLVNQHKTDKHKWYQEAIRCGDEGVMLKNLNAPYIPDKRPAGTWVKVKRQDTYDVVITGYVPAEREYTGKFMGDGGAWLSGLKDWPYWVDDDDFPVHLMGEADFAYAEEHRYQPVTKLYWHNWIGAVRFGQYKDGELIELGQTSGMSDAVREEISKNQGSYLGRVIEVEAMERIKKTGALRHPRFVQFRDDKLPQDCIWGEC